MFGIKRIPLSAIDPADLRRFAVVVEAVAGWRSDGKMEERLLIGRLRHTMVFVVEDVQRGKTPELTEKTIKDLLRLAEFFNEEIGGVADNQARQSPEPEKVYETTNLLRDASRRVAAGLRAALGVDETIPAAKASPAAVTARIPRFCTQCGTKLAPASKFCQECGSSTA